MTRSGCAALGCPRVGCHGGRWCAQIPGGWMAQLYGGRLMLIICFVLWSAVSIVTPTNARNTLTIVIARVCVGVAQGFLIPAVHTVLSQVKTDCDGEERGSMCGGGRGCPVGPSCAPHSPLVGPVPAQWIPPHERARAVSLTTSGAQQRSAAHFGMRAVHVDTMITQRAVGTAEAVQLRMPGPMARSHCSLRACPLAHGEGAGMYLGSALAMLVLPAVAARFGAASILKVVGGQGLAWLAMWMVVGREIPHRCACSCSRWRKSRGGNEDLPLMGVRRRAGRDCRAAAAAATERRETVIPLTVIDQSNGKGGGGAAGGGGGGGSGSAGSKGRPGPTPWNRMLGSSAVWAIVVNNFSFHYAFYVVMNWLPTYFTK